MDAVERNMNILDYIYNVLEPVVKQQENSRPHITFVDIRFLRDSKYTFMPVRSPNFSPIAHVRNSLGRKLGQFCNLSRHSIEIVLF